MPRVPLRSLLVGLAFAALAVVPCCLSGCGGSSGADRDARGAVSMHIVWPAATPAGTVPPAVIPSATQGLRITLTHGAWQRVVNVARPSGQTTSDVNITDVPVGPVHMNVGAYSVCSGDPPVTSGDLLAWAVTDLNVVPNVATPAGVTLGTAPDHVVVSAGGASTVLNVDETLDLTATAYDADDNILLTTATEWTSGNSDVASVDGGGKVTALFPGLSIITATIEGVEGKLDVRVNGWELYDQAPGPGSYNTIVCQDKIFCFGPNTIGGGPTAHWHVYTPATRDWQAATDLPVRRYLPALGVIGGKIYLAENFDVNVNKTYEIDPTTLAVTERAPMPTGVYGAAATVFGGKLWLIGGVDGYASPRATVQVYDPTTNTWATKNNFPVAGGFGSAAVYGGRLYVCGAGGGLPTTSVYVYNTTDDTWAQATPLGTPRTYAGLGLSSDRLYAIGGSISSVLTGTTSVEFFDGALWHPGPPLPEPLVTWNSSAQAVVDNYLYVIGGNHNGNDVQSVYRLWVGPGVSP
jgi:hypothetical protein